MNFSDSIKNWFFKNNSNAADSGVRIPLLDADGTILGYETVANIKAQFGNFFIGTCSTAADTAAKTATISNFALGINCCVAITFTNAIRAASPTLNINSTGAKSIYYMGTALTQNVVNAGNTVIFQYDGTKYNIISIEGNERSQKDYAYVDLGLPSGLRWASRNIDVTQTDNFQVSPTQYECTFFSWGNVHGYNPVNESFANVYDWGSTNPQEPYYEGQPYGETEGSLLTANLSPTFDAARTILGAPWRLPTAAEFQELIYNTQAITSTGTVITGEDKIITMDGIEGVLLQSTVSGYETRTIFFPCCGYGNGTEWSQVEYIGNYWTSTYDSSQKCCAFRINTNGLTADAAINRYRGFPIRPVQ